MLNKSYLHEITKEDVFSSLPPFPKSRASEGRQKIEALIKAYNYSAHMKNCEVRAIHLKAYMFSGVYFQRSLLEGQNIFLEVTLQTSFYPRPQVYIIFITSLFIGYVEIQRLLALANEMIQETVSLSVGQMP